MTSNHSLSIIIVDDEMELASLYREYLETKGYEVVSFTNPLLALEYYKSKTRRFTHVFTDLRMPEMSGIDLAYNIRKLDEKVKILLITAFEMGDLNKDNRFRNAGIEMVIQKPVHLKTLKEYLSESVIEDDTKSTIAESYIQSLSPKV